VISVGHVVAGTADAPNIIPSRATVTGTARSFSPDVRDTIERRLGEIARAHALAFGCTAEIAYRRLSPALVTQAEQTAISLRVAAALVG
jgi:metal-dependent amidase/aminoacylase/carboxypeptidase family protein